MKSINKHTTNQANTEFSVSKWFMDCVSEEGTCIIAYAAEMRKKGIVIPYKSLLISEPGKEAVIKTKFKTSKWPQLKGECIQWDDESLGIKGHWKQKGSSLKSRLYDSEKGKLDWHCYQSSSSANIGLNNQLDLKGYGYIEHLSLTIEPWKLKIKKLRWGRFISDNINLVWIDFTGAQAQRWVWHNGDYVVASVLNDEEIIIPTMELKLKLKLERILERGHKMLKVARGILQFISGFNKQIPDLFLKTNETKWLSKGTLYHQEKVISEGWAIHELVDFN